MGNTRVCGNDPGDDLGDERKKVVSFYIKERDVNVRDLLPF